MRPLLTVRRLLLSELHTIKEFKSSDPSSWRTERHFPRRRHRWNVWSVLGVQFRWTFQGKTRASSTIPRSLSITHGPIRTAAGRTRSNILSRWWRECTTLLLERAPLADNWKNPFRWCEPVTGVLRSTFFDECKAMWLTNTLAQYTDWTLNHDSRNSLPLLLCSIVTEERIVELHLWDKFKKQMVEGYVR